MSAAAHNPLLEYNPLLDYMHGALEHEHKGVQCWRSRRMRWRMRRMLALTPEPEVLNKEPELAAIVTAPGGRPAV